MPLSCPPKALVSASLLARIKQNQGTVSTSPLLSSRFWGPPSALYHLHIILDLFLSLQSVILENMQGIGRHISRRKERRTVKGETYQKAGPSMEPPGFWKSQAGGPGWGTSALCSRSLTEACGPRDVGLVCLVHGEAVYGSATFTGLP